MNKSKVRSQKSKIQVKIKNFLVLICTFAFCLLPFELRRSLSPKKRLSSSYAFTLIELLVVIAIIGILVTLTFVAILPIQRKSRDARRKADVNSFLAAANLFKADFKIYPNPTFYLGSYGIAANTEANSNYGLDTDIPNCNNATLGPTVNFMQLNGETLVTAGKPTAAELGPSDASGKKLTLKPGFASANNFMICLKYIDKILVDPKPASAAPVDAYQYRASFDYGDILVAAELETSTDSDASQLFTVSGTDPSPATYKRYYRGSGVVVRHLDDSSDTSSLFSGLSGTNSDGSYLYQCLKDSLGATIAKDNRSSNEPIVTSGSGYAGNTNCQNASGGLDVETSH